MSCVAVKVGRCWACQPSSIMHPSCMTSVFLLCLVKASGAEDLSLIYELIICYKSELIISTCYQTYSDYWWF